MNKLTVNTKKTKAMLIFPKRLDTLFPRFMVYDHSLDYVESYKYLGYIVDSRLRFEEMLNNLIAIISHKLYLLSRLRPMLTQRAAVVYKSKILAYFDYSAVLQFSIRAPLLWKLQVLQNRAIHIILRLPSRTNVDRQHLYLSLLHTEHRREYFLMNLMYQLHSSYGLNYTDDRQLQTRAHAGLMYRIPVRSSSIFMKSFSYRGMTMWNRLPIPLRNIAEYETFKRQMKQMLREHEADLYDGWSMVSASVLDPVLPTGSFDDWKFLSGITILLSNGTFIHICICVCTFVSLSCCYTADKIFVIL